MPPDPPLHPPLHPPLDLFWTSAFLDLEPGSWEAGSAFWSAVTGYAVSPTRGPADEFASLVPPDGDDHLRLQRLGAGPSRIHLDLHVPDPAAAADLAEGLGARVVERSQHDYVVLASPAGLTFCFVAHPGAVRARPTEHGGHRSLVDQVCLDVPAARAGSETAFWSALTGWEARAGRAGSEFAPLVRPPGMPLRLMVQGVGDERDPATAHLDLAATDRAAETDRHVLLGARVRSVTEHFTVLVDPAGSAYCITDRDPDTGLLP